MDKILLIIQREYLSRVKKKSFIIMTLLGPLLLAGVMIIPTWLAMNSSSDQKILVLDKSGIFKDQLDQGDKIKFEYLDITLAEGREFIETSDHTGLLLIPNMSIDNIETLQLYTKKGAGFEIIGYIKRVVSDRVRQLKLEAKGFNTTEIEQLSSKVELESLKLNQENGGKDKETNVTAATMAGFICAFLIYFFIFLYGVQVMKGVMEEKSNRIVEVIVSSVKPFQLMMGKVVGVAAVSLTQFLAWIILSLGVTMFVSSFTNMRDFKQENIEQTMAVTDNPESAMEINGFLKAAESVNIPLVIGCFLFFFLGGYLIYAALFAAVGAAVDNDTDTQQFMLPITIPMIVAFMVAQGVMSDPDSPVAFWFSIFPLTSPIVMMIRVPFGIPVWEIILSMVLLIAGFVTAIWFAGRIYRVGILMYGKKVSYKEIGKWLFYKN